VTRHDAPGKIQTWLPTRSCSWPSGGAAAGRVGSGAGGQRCRARRFAPSAGDPAPAGHPAAVPADRPSSISAAVAWAAAGGLCAIQVLTRWSTDQTASLRGVVPHTVVSTGPGLLALGITCLCALARHNLTRVGAGLAAGAVLGGVQGVVVALVALHDTPH